MENNDWMIQEAEENVVEITTSQTELQSIEKVLPNHLTIIPLSQRPIFPGLTVPMTFSGKNNLNAIKQAVEQENGYIGLALARILNAENSYESELYETGTIFQIYRIIPIAPETIQVLGQGVTRFKKRSKRTVLLRFSIDGNQVQRCFLIK
ncbi:MAG: hypothetical protein HC892_22285 [Saprospiraceae bacterium]|nr:hypothetical protein [Saprospiraceae bacterium]